MPDTTGVRVATPALTHILPVLCIMCFARPNPPQAHAEAAAAGGPPSSQLAALLVDALTARQGSAGRQQGLSALADALGLNPEDRARLGLNPAAAAALSGAGDGLQGAGYGSGVGEEYNGSLGTGAAAAAQHGYGYGAAADITPPRDGGGGGGGGRGRRSVLGRVVGALFGGGRRDGQQGELRLCWGETAGAERLVTTLDEGRATFNTLEEEGTGVAVPKPVPHNSSTLCDYCRHFAAVGSPARS